MLQLCLLMPSPTPTTSPSSASSAAEGTDQVSDRAGAVLLEERAALQSATPQDAPHGGPLDAPQGVHGASAHEAAPLQLTQGLGFRLSRLTRLLRARWARQLEELGLTPPQAAVLRGVAERPGCSLRALARTLGADPMKVKRCVDVLERRGLLRSAHRGTDRRPRALDLTPESLALASRVDTLVRAQEEHLAAVLGADGLSRIESALAALEADLGLSQAPERSARPERFPLHTKGTAMTTADPNPTFPGNPRQRSMQDHEGGEHGVVHGGRHHDHGADSSPGAAWDERYRGMDWPTDPDALLVELASPLQPGRAIDLGCGPGRNAVWLARLGWRVTGVDASAVGLSQAKERAAREGLALDLVQADLLSYTPPQAAFDLVVVANVHFAPEERGLFFSRAVSAVAPGGHVFVAGHHLDSFGKVGPPFPERLYTEELLTALLAPLAVDVRRHERQLEDNSLIVDAVAWASAPSTTGGGR
jgi:DNA-binding MarR family transcriptional regulator/SAM-dependent methyltransferase